MFPGYENNVVADIRRLVSAAGLDQSQFFD
jgi:hypothetical protein